MSNNEKISCVTIGVDCTRNDPVDIRAGGPEYLGFDFHVRKEEENEMKEFIAETLVEFAVPVLNIYSNGARLLPEEKVWTKDRIHKEIEKEAEYLQEEAERDYNVHGVK